MKFLLVKIKYSNIAIEEKTLHVQVDIVRLTSDRRCRELGRSIAARRKERQNAEAV